MRAACTAWFLLLALSACGSSTAASDAAVGDDGGGGGDGAVATDGALPDGGAPDRPSSCDFDYDDVFVYSLAAPTPLAPLAPRSPGAGGGQIAYADPPPPGVHRVPRAGDHDRGAGDIVMPDYTDTMPLFPRGAAWTAAQRCYETPSGVQLLTEPEAHDLYRAIAERTTGVAVDTTPGVRTVVGVRGSYPGRFTFHGNLPDRFNDTLVLLWIDGDGPHVREFPVNTDTGARDFGVDSSSSLRPNRRYHYRNGWHNTYNAFHVDETDYLVMDDTNHNGHWDSDRNGWLPPTDAVDHERTGSGHNIHMGSVDAPLGTAVVDGWSAGCQVIPGMANWTEFITNGWTQLDDPVNYFLVDVRDIDPRVWSGDCTPDGTHACPYRIDAFPFAATGDTTAGATSAFDVYSCSTADESGPEVVYQLTVDRSGTLTATLDDVMGDAVDLDVHLLDADDAQACLARGDVALSRAIGPGRYFIVVDTYVTGGTPQVGPYHLDVTFQ
jgi:hypothetical protein